MGLMCGAALGIVVISIGIIRYKTGMILRGDQTLSLVYWIIFATSIFVTVIRYKKLDPLSFSFKRTIQIGLFAGLVSGTLYTLYIVVLNNYIDTELSSQITQFSEQELIRENPAMTEEERADALKFTTISSALRGFMYIFVCMTFGTIYSFVSTVIAKRASLHLFDTRPS